MINRKHQTGITFLGFLIGCMVVGSFAYIAMRLWPVLNEKLKVDKALETAAAQPNVAQQSKKNLADHILRHFEIEDVDQFSTLKSMKGIFDVKRIKNKNKRRMSMKYEIRRQMLGNLDVVYKYDKSIDIDGLGH